MSPIEHPKFDVLGDSISGIQLIQHVGDDKTVVNSARASYAKDNRNPFNESDAKLLKHLFSVRHDSVQEHTYITFVVDAPIFVTRQWMRHRLSSFNEISYRYVEVADDKFYVPLVPRVQHKKNKQASYIPTGDTIDLPSGKTLPKSLWEPKVSHEFQFAYNRAYESYERLLNLGVARELARAVLPVGGYTRFYYSANLRSMLHFIELRTHDGAQLEIRKYAEKMLEVLKELFPLSIAAWEDARASENRKAEIEAELEQMRDELNSVKKDFDKLVNLIEPIRYKVVGENLVYDIITDELVDRESGTHYPNTPLQPMNTP